jgi:hypothetical protein
MSLQVAEPSQFGRDGTPFATEMDDAPGTMTYPAGDQMKSILDPSFRYTQSVETDLRKTFARVRRDLRKQQQELSKSGAEVKVLLFHSRKTAG